jgi:hypothetical protein
MDVFNKALCQGSNQVEFHLKPYTAGVRCLTFDGHDKFDLQRLKTLEKNIGLPVRLPDLFDICTAAGPGT